MPVPHLWKPQAAPRPRPRPGRGLGLSGRGARGRGRRLAGDSPVPSLSAALRREAEDASRAQVESSRRCEKDRRALLAQVGALEAELEEQLSRQQATAVQASELCALRQQVESLDKHLRGQRQFMDVSVPRAPCAPHARLCGPASGLQPRAAGGARRASGRAGPALVAPTEQPEPRGRTLDPHPRGYRPVPATSLGPRPPSGGRPVQLRFRGALPGPSPRSGRACPVAAPAPAWEGERVVSVRPGAAPLPPPSCTRALQREGVRPGADVAASHAQRPRLATGAGRGAGAGARGIPAGDPQPGGAAPPRAAAPGPRPRRRESAPPPPPGSAFQLQAWARGRRRALPGGEARGPPPWATCQLSPVGGSCRQFACSF